MQIFELQVMGVSNEIANFRATETGRREQFMRTEGPYLPPLFFQMVPSLKEKPPFFTPSLTEVVSKLRIAVINLIVPFFTSSACLYNVSTGAMVT